MPVAVSLVVCTYNRADLLPKCLESLISQTAASDQYEVLVIDNASTDATKQIVEAICQRHANVHYHLELKQGLAHARNRGLNLAAGDFVGYIDDDAFVCPEYVESALRAIASCVPTPHCVGGPIQPFYTSPKPVWFKDNYEARRIWDSARYLTSGQSFSGSNQVWQKVTLKSLGGFDINAGVTGKTLRMGEETAVFCRAWETLFQPGFYYSPLLTVYHWVPPFKMAVAYQLKRRMTVGQSEARLDATTFTARVRHFTVMGAAFTKAILRALWRGRAHLHWQNWVVEDWGRVARAAGGMLGCLTGRAFFKQS